MLGRLFGRIIDRITKQNTEPIKINILVDKENCVYDQNVIFNITMPIEVVLSSNCYLVIDNSYHNLNAFVQSKFNALNVNK
jgi:hypothetical protein